MVTLTLDGVGASYGARRVLEGISTPDFHSGDVVAVLGPNAAGKSTLLRRIAGLMRGDGKVIVGGADNRAGTVSYLPQDSGAGGVITIYESILLALKQDGGWRVSGEDLDRVDLVLADLGLEPIASRALGELSGGQRQLAGIAQCLVRDPRILLMDEPTSALDLYHQIEVLALVRRLARERDMIVIAALHDLNLAIRHADKAVVIAEGRQYACGSCAEIVQPAMLRDVYKVKARVEACSHGHRHVVLDGAL